MTEEIREQIRAEAREAAAQAGPPTAEQVETVRQAFALARQEAA
jgi:hypothetical protein